MAEIYYEPSGCDCAGTSYSEDAINTAAQKCIELASQGQTLGRDKYPHAYNDYEKFKFANAVAPYLEFPVLTSGVYDGGEPGADRVILGSIADDYSSAVYAATITHTGESDDKFKECVDNEQGSKVRKHAPAGRTLKTRIDLK